MIERAKRLSLVGIEGFSRYHLEQIEHLKNAGEVELAALMARPDSLEREAVLVERLRSGGVRIYSDYGEMLGAERERVDIVVLPVPIADHSEMVMGALGAGYHVICEKPVAGTLAECERMRNAWKASGRVLSICFQDIYSTAVQSLKERILSGRMGRLLAARARVLWPRADAYYSGDWRGRLTHRGKVINDCPLMNATAHYLNLMLYLAGSSHHTAAIPRSVYAENYRIKQIESADTQYLRIVTHSDVVIQFITSHATAQRVEPNMVLEFEYGRIEWEFGGRIRAYAKLADGNLVETDHSAATSENLHWRIYTDTCAAITEGRQPLATIDNSWQQVLCVEYAFRSGGIVTVPDSYISSETVLEDDDCLKAGDCNRYIADIADLTLGMLEQGKSFAEAGCRWAQPGQVITIEDSALLVGH